MQTSIQTSEAIEPTQT
ncbi:hypothetical protein S40285_10850, partial [Stachybotrys chlorohalonatus IBT 40285]